MQTTIVSRVFISFFGNIIKAFISLITGLILARELGPEEYGIFAFLLASFVSLTQLLDMGSSNAFFTFISKKIPSKSYFKNYMIWMFVQFILSITLIGLIAPESWIERIWQGVERYQVIVAFIAVFLQQQVWQMLSQIGESQRFTAKVQSLNIKIALIHFAIILIIVWMDVLEVELVFLFVSLEFFIAIFYAFHVFPLKYSNEYVSFNKMFIEYREYCIPLIPYAWLSMISAFADTWLLQRFGGSSQQAYYAVAMQFSTISLIATRSILKILWKEVAESYSKGHYERVRELFRNAIITLYTLGAIISGFLIPWVSEIINLTLGEAYIGGVIVMSIMFLYPVDQARGQVAGAMFLSMEKTRPYVFIGMISMVLSTVLAYFMLAPTDENIPGFGLGATGLAIKMVSIQLLTVNFSIWWLSKKLGGKFDWAYQFYVLGLFIALGYLSYVGVNEFLGESVNVIIRGGVTGALYLTISLYILYLFPSLVAIKRYQMKEFVLLLFNKLRRN